METNDSILTEVEKYSAHILWFYFISLMYFILN
ncbi:hypothetical protein KOCBH_05531 [Klebsiella michiganensis]|nr:hypothetical protein KOCBH_05531 [Klebsiella michiganensis]